MIKLKDGWLIVGVALFLFGMAAGVLAERGRHQSPRIVVETVNYQGVKV